MVSRERVDSPIEKSTHESASEIVSGVLGVVQQVEASTESVLISELTSLAEHLMAATVAQMKQSRFKIVDLGIAWKCLPERGSGLKLNDEGQLFFVINYVEFPLTIAQVCSSEQQARQLVDQLTIKLFQAARGSRATQF